MDGVEIANILRLTDEDTRNEIARTPWSCGDDELRKKVEAMLSRSFNFRPQFVHGRPVERKAAWFLTRFAYPEARQLVADALVQYHLTRRSDLLGAFLDGCGVLHNSGHIPDDHEYTLPADGQLRAVIQSCIVHFGARDVWIYLETAAARMGREWSRARTLFLQELDEAQKATASEVEDTAVSVEREEPREHGHGFTTLDMMLIKTVISSVSAIEGALTTDQVDEVIDEMVHLSSDRHRSYFHRGFLDTLLDRPRAAGHETNPSRRAWQLAGELAAFARRGDYTAIVRKYDAVPAEFDEMMSRDAAISGARDLFDALWIEGHRSRAAQSLSADVVRRRGPAFMRLVLDRAIQLIHGQQEPDARRLLEVLLNAMDDHSRELLGADFEFEVDRRLSQCQRVSGFFQQAAEELTNLRTVASEDLGAELHADLGLCRGEFRRLADVRIPLVRADAKVMIARIRAGSTEFEEAIVSKGRRANAHYVLGTLALLEGNYRSAREHLFNAYESAIGDKGLMDRYRSSGVYARILVGYALAIFLQCAEVHFGFATELLREADAHLPRNEWPEWLLMQAITEVAGYSAEAGSFVDFVSDRFPSVLEKASADASILGRSDVIRGVIERNAVDDSRPRADRWADNLTLFEYYRSTKNRELANLALDRLEELALENADLRARFVKFLDVPSGLDPIWSDEDITWSRVQMLRLDGRIDEAASALLQLGNRYIALDRDEDLEEVLARLRVCDAEGHYAKSLLSFKPVSAECFVEASDEDVDAMREFLDQRSVRVLFVGGAEKLKVRSEQVTEALAARFGDRLSVEFAFDAWSHNTGRTLDSLRNSIAAADVVVLSNLMRTNLGHSLRRHLNNEKKVRGTCPVAGVDGMARAIEDAVRRFARTVGN